MAVYAKAPMHPSNICNTELRDAWDGVLKAGTYFTGVSTVEPTAQPCYGRECLLSQSIFG